MRGSPARIAKKRQQTSPAVRRESLKPFGEQIAVAGLGQSNGERTLIEDRQLRERFAELALLASERDEGRLAIGIRIEDRQ